MKDFSVTPTPFQTGERIWNAVIEQIGELRGFFFAALRTCLLFLRQNIFVLLVASALCLAGSLKIWNGKVPFYQAEMSVSYVFVPKKIYGDMVDKLNVLLRNKDYKTLGATLEVSEEDLTKVLSFNAQSIYRSNLSNDYTPKDDPFYLSVQMKTPIELQKLEEGLINYFNSPVYIQERLRGSRESALNEIAFLENKLKLIESALTKSGPSAFLGKEVSEDEMSPGLALIKESQNIDKRIRKLKNLLAYKMKNAEVRTSFLINEQVGKPRISLYIMAGLVGGLLLTLLKKFIFG
jgi:hypothetical protein